MDPDTVSENTDLNSENNLDAPYIVGLSIIGTSHEKNELPCQDANKFKILESGISIIAVSDGLGSAAHSEIGATVAVDSVINFIMNYLDENKFSVDDSSVLLKSAFEFARNALKMKANSDQQPIQGYACTLIVVLIIEKTAIVAQIGDGAVIAKTQNDYKAVSVPEEQEYVNEVTPLTSSSWEGSLKVSPLFSDIETLVAFTDGCQRAILIKNRSIMEANSPFLEAFFSYLNTLSTRSEKEQFLKDIIESKKFSDISDDDKTLVVAVL